MKKNEKNLNISNSNWFNILEISRLLQVSDQTVRNYLNDFKEFFDKPHVQGKTAYYSEKDVKYLTEIYNVCREYKFTRKQCKDILKTTPLKKFLNDSLNDKSNSEKIIKELLQNNQEYLLQEQAEFEDIKSLIYKFSSEISTQRDNYEKLVDGINLNLIEIYNYLKGVHSILSRIDQNVKPNSKSIKNNTKN